MAKTSAGGYTPHHARHEPAGSDAMAVDAAAATGSLRTLGTAATSATQGDRLSAYDVFYAAAIRLDAAAANTYLMVPGGAYSGALASFFQAAVYFDPADFALSGRTTKYRVLAWCLANNTASTRNFTVGLYPMTAPAGGAVAVTGTVGTVITGSTVVFTTPAANSSASNNSGDFNAPAAGWLALGVVVSAAMAANSSVVVGATLQRRWT